MKDLPDRFFLNLLLWQQDTELPTNKIFERLKEMMKSKG